MILRKSKRLGSLDALSGRKLVNAHVICVDALVDVAELTFAEDVLQLDELSAHLVVFGCGRSDKSARRPAAEIDRKLA